MEGVFIYEFLFRGGETSAPDDDTWHVRLARVVTNIRGGTQLEITDPLTPGQAAELGFTLASICSALNQKAAEDVASLQVRVRDLTEELDTARAANRSLDNGPDHR